jgi:hypothetical protein
MPLKIRMRDGAAYAALPSPESVIGLDALDPKRKQLSYASGLS